MTDQIFCPNCGKPVSSNDKFCPYCGYDLASFQATQNLTNHPEPVPRPNPAAVSPKKPWSKRQKVILGAIIAGIVVLIGGYVWGSNYYSPTNQAARLVKAVRAGDSGTVSQYVGTTDPNLKVTATTIKPLITYYQDHLAELDHLQTVALTNSAGLDNSTTLNFTKIGRHFLIFPKYGLQVTGVHPKITTNTANTTVTANGLPIAGFKAGTQDQTVGPLIPGEYTIKATAQISGQNVQASGNYTLTTEDTQPIDLSFKTVSFTALGYPGAEVYVGGHKAGSIDDDGQLAIHKYPVTNSAEYYQVFTANGQKVQSRSQKVSDLSDGAELAVAYPGVISHGAADSLITSIFGNLNTLSDFDSSYSRESLTKNFIGGSDNKDCAALLAMGKSYRDDKNINSVNITTDFKHVYPIERNNALIIFNVKFRFDNAHIDGFHVQEYQYTGNIKKSDGDFKVDSFKISKKIDDHHED